MARILLIDDDDGFREMVCLALEEAGYEVLQAVDGREGVALYGKHSPDLVITDIIMPNQEGVETISILMRDFPGARIFAVSGGGGSGIVDALPVARKLGAVRTFAKPFSVKELLGAIREEIGRQDPSSR